MEFEHPINRSIYRVYVANALDAIKIKFGNIFSLLENFFLPTSFYLKF